MGQRILDYTLAVTDAIHVENQVPPIALDGLSDNESRPASDPPTTNERQSHLHNAVDAMRTQLKKGLPHAGPEDVRGAIDFFTHEGEIDDRLDFFTRSLHTISIMPPGKKNLQANNTIITKLYDTLTHPPATYLGKRFRSADGSGNSFANPDIGKTGLPYARSVQGKHPQPAHLLPDPGLIFDTLLKAKPGKFEAHPNGNSALTFAFASIVTHSLFRTDPKDWNKNNTTSYLDLSPLYGVNQVEQDSVRDKGKGRGLLYPDTFADPRLGLLPPACSVLLVIFSRNHNYIANILLKINERGEWKDPDTLSYEDKMKQDEEIFQTARLVNCGHFMAMIFGDYVGSFLGLNRDGNTWNLKPFDIIRKDDGEFVPRGEGNHVSVEFNLLYRWHSTTAQPDITWTENLMRGVINKPLGEATDDDFLNAMPQVSRKILADPSKRPLGTLKRQGDGTFNDDELAKILHDATETPAGAYRARGTPECLRAIEIMTIKQARKWSVCTLNEFREFLGLKKLESFEEWNPDPEIAHAARLLYNHIDNLELYPGLQAEQIIQPGPGSGICCGYTMTRAILGDAISLVRGDRFYTTDFTPANLTCWGFEDCQRDPDNGAYGAALPKLLFRHLPRHYPANSVYALFPFFTIEQTKKNLTKLHVLAKYNTVRPKADPIPKVVNTLSAIDHVFSPANIDKFKTTYGPDMNLLTNDYGFFLVFDKEQEHAKDRRLVLNALFPENERSQDTLDKFKTWYREKTQEMFDKKSIVYDGVRGKYVDIVHNVINLVSVHWAADFLCGIPLKTDENPCGLVTEQELSLIFTLLFSCVFENINPEVGWKLREKAFAAGQMINTFIEQSINEVAPSTSSNPLVGLFNLCKTTWRKPKESDGFLSRLAQSGRPVRELVACVIGLAVGSSVNFSQAVAQVVDFYLDEKNVKYKDEIIELVKENNPENDELLQGYVREAMRFNPQFGGLFRKVDQAASIPLGKDQDGNSIGVLHVEKGDLVYSDYKTAHMNPVDFLEPEKVNPRRPKNNYRLQGSGFHLCPGVDFVMETVPEMLKVIFSKKNLRRAPGVQGFMPSFILSDKNTKADAKMYLDPHGAFLPWPGSLQVVYDE